jgi:nucleotide-binding universal stress UspA family protein
MMKFERILVALNSPNGRDAAFERALTLAQASGAELYLLHAVPANQPFSFRAAERLERMAEMRTRADNAGVRAIMEEQHGDPAETIGLHADARKADLIVMGGEPRRGWRRRSVVAERVLRRTSVPTLVVPSDVAERPAAFRNVLVAADLSPDSLDVLASAIALTAGEAERVTVMHTARGLEPANPVQGRAHWLVPEYRAHVLADARESLQELISEVPASVPTGVHVAVGPVARTIVEHAADIDADLVVVGRGRGFRLLGSTAQRVVRTNDRALLVVPSRARLADRLERDRAA